MKKQIAAIKNCCITKKRDDDLSPSRDQLKERRGPRFTFSCSSSSSSFEFQDIIFEFRSVIWLIELMGVLSKVYKSPSLSPA